MGLKFKLRNRFLSILQLCHLFCHSLCERFIDSGDSESATVLVILCLPVAVRIWLVLHVRRRDKVHIS